MTKVYIAGPITGVEDYENNFNKAAAAIRWAGAEPLNPISEGLVEDWAYKDYIDRGLKMLMEADAVLLLDGWRNSPGAKLESYYAKICGIPRITEVDL